MNTELLPIGEQDELKVQGIDAHDYDIRYDFDTKNLLTEERKKNSRKISSYFIRRDLVHAVNAAIVTGRPLLLKGAPGCGKTKLAIAVASQLYGEELYKHYFEWHVKSKSRAKDGGYTFDHVGRLRDATISPNDEKARKRVMSADNYISLGALGYAFTSKTKDKKKPILLIDEIDKGDIDFPNDLLLELDEMRFKINERPGTYIEAPDDLRPLVFITSNDERELPPAFLRRCLYFKIPDFDKGLLTKIANSKMKDFYEDFGGKDLETLKKAPVGEFVDTFISLRDSTSGTKQPSTSEMLDWLKLITFHVIEGSAEMKNLIKDEQLQKIALKLNA